MHLAASHLEAPEERYLIRERFCKVSLAVIPLLRNAAGHKAGWERFVIVRLRASEMYF